MKLKAKNKAKNKWADSWKDELKSCAKFAADVFNIRNKDFTVEIQLGWDEKESGAAYAMTVEPMKKFVIFMNGYHLLKHMDLDYIREILFHEMTHIKQEFHDGLLMDETYAGEHHFDGMVYYFATEEAFNEAYMALPWEVEARNMQKVLLTEYKNCLQF